MASALEWKAEGAHERYNQIRWFRSIPISTRIYLLFRFSTTCNALGSMSARRVAHDYSDVYKRSR